MPHVHDTRRAAFTLLEIVVVITILAFLAAMVVPALGALNNAQRAKLTQERLQQIRRAILGARDQFDEAGNPVAGGYVADKGRLPKLCEGLYGEFVSPNVWAYVDDPAEMGTQIFTILTDAVQGDHESYSTLNEGQPRGLFTTNLQGDGEDADEQINWKGPYIQEPHDIFPNDTSHLANSTADYQGLTSNDPELFRQLQTNGKFSDAWGRALRFFVDDNATPADNTDDSMWIISAGPDGLIDVPGDISVYDENLDNNVDNIVLTIAAADWYTLVESKITETQGIIEAVRNAIIGKAGESREQTFYGDVGAQPQLYAWNDPNWDLENEVDLLDPDVETIHPQPRGLWDQAPDGITNLPSLQSDPALADYGFGWRRQYIDTPWGANEENQLIVDAWNRPLHFYYENLSTPQVDDDILQIMSAGPNGVYVDTVGDEDNVERTIEGSDWQLTANVTFQFPVSNSLVLSSPDKTTRAKFFYAPSAVLSLASDDPGVLFYDPNTDGIGVWTIFVQNATVATGSRWLFIWEDDDDSSTYDVGEPFVRIEIDVLPGDTSPTIFPASFDMTAVGGGS